MNLSDFVRSDRENHQVQDTQSFCHIVVVTACGELDFIDVRPHTSCVAYGLRFVPDLTRRNYVRVGRETVSDDEIRRHGFELRLDGRRMHVGRNGRLLSNGATDQLDLHVTVQAYLSKTHMSRKIAEESRGALLLVLSR